VWNAKALEAKKVCLGMKHIFTSRGECKRLSPIIPKCTLTFGVTFVWESWIFKAFVERLNKHQIGPHDLNYKCMNYDQKKGHESNWEFDSRPQIPLHSTCTNHLLPWLCMLISFWTFACEFALVPFWSPNTPSYPQKCYELRNVPQVLGAVVV
jgi:hypothetical protein